MPFDDLSYDSGGFLDPRIFPRLVEFLRKNAVKAVSGSGLKVQQTGGGTLVSDGRRKGFWATLTAEPSTGAYTFNRTLPVSAGAGLWAEDSTLSGTAHEANATPGLVSGGPLRVWMEVVSVADGSQYRFSFDSCV